MSLKQKILDSNDFEPQEKEFLLSKLNEEVSIENVERIPVESSNLESVGYSKVDEMLEIEFKSGSVYRYYDVEEEVYEGLMDADSHGSFFHYNIKEANYEYYQHR